MKRVYCLIILFLVFGTFSACSLDVENENESTSFSKYYDFEKLIYAVSEMECSIDQLRFLIPVLESRNQDRVFDSDYFAESFGVVMGGLQSHQNPRMNRLQELQLLLIEAKHITNNINGLYDNTPIVIAGFAPPWVRNSTYGVMLLGEEHTALIDMIIEFTGIPERLLEVTVIDELPTSLLPR